MRRDSDVVEHIKHERVAAQFKRPTTDRLFYVDAAHLAAKIALQ